MSCTPGGGRLWARLAPAAFPSCHKACRGSSLGRRSATELLLLHSSPAPGPAAPARLPSQAKCCWLQGRSQAAAAASENAGRPSSSAGSAVGRRSALVLRLLLRSHPLTAAAAVPAAAAASAGSRLPPPRKGAASAKGLGRSVGSCSCPAPCGMPAGNAPELQLPNQASASAASAAGANREASLASALAT